MTGEAGRERVWRTEMEGARERLAQKLLLMKEAARERWESARSRLAPCGIRTWLQISIGLVSLNFWSQITSLEPKILLHEGTRSEPVPRGNTSLGLWQTQPGLLEDGCSLIHVTARAQRAQRRIHLPLGSGLDASRRNWSRARAAHAQAQHRRRRPLFFLPPLRAAALPVQPSPPLDGTRRRQRPCTFHHG